MSNNNTNSNKINVPEARAAMEQFKFEVANEIGVPLKKGYNGDLTSAQNGYVGGYMVKKMIEKQEQMMAEKNQGLSLIHISLPQYCDNTQAYRDLSQSPSRHSSCACIYRQYSEILYNTQVQSVSW